MSVSVGFHRLALVSLMLASSACSASAPSFNPTDLRSPLILERTILLPDTQGRIDHLAINLAGQRLFVAEVANGTVDMIDLKSGKVVNRIAGLKEPQGVAWLPKQGELVVACGDGTVHFYDQGDQREIAAIALGDDADNVRVDERNGQVVVGYGSGGLATIDPETHRVVSRVTFKGHPEGFRLTGGQAFVNVPDDGAILAVDRDGQKVAARWSTGMHRLNFPMALDPSGRSMTIAYRLPATLARLDTRTGETISSQSICGDADDLFLDGASEMVVCGAGHVDVVRHDRIEATVETSGGTRTGLFVPELRTLFVAVPARGKPAAIWVFRVDAAG
jgi:DNA-binding beta-propeller fold protein YncE